MYGGVGAMNEANCISIFTTLLTKLTFMLTINKY